MFCLSLINSLVVFGNTNSIVSGHFIFVQSGLILLCSGCVLFVMPQYLPSSNLSSKIRELNSVM